MKYKIVDIKDIVTYETRNDGRYPLRKGSIVSLLDPYVQIGDCPVLVYHKDNEGNPKDGHLRLSRLTEIENYDKAVVLYTMNSVYYLFAEEDNND